VRNAAGTSARQHRHIRGRIGGSASAPTGLAAAAVPAATQRPIINIAPSARAKPRRDEGFPIRGSLKHYVEFRRRKGVCRAVVHALSRQLQHRIRGRLQGGVFGDETREIAVRVQCRARGRDRCRYGRGNGLPTVYSGPNVEVSGNEVGTTDRSVDNVVKSIVSGPIATTAEINAVLVLSRVNPAAVKEAKGAVVPVDTLYRTRKLAGWHTWLPRPQDWVPLSSRCRLPTERTPASSPQWR